jgi:hypothetical protein
MFGTGKVLLGKGKVMTVKNQLIMIYSVKALIILEDHSCMVIGIFLLQSDETILIKS